MKNRIYSLVVLSTLVLTLTATGAIAATAPLSPAAQQRAAQNASYAKYNAAVKSADNNYNAAVKAAQKARTEAKAVANSILQTELKTIKTTKYTAVRVLNLSPSVGAPGTTVTVNGQGFATNNNTVLFGPSAHTHHLDGSPDNAIANANSADGKTFTFSVPATGPVGTLCSDKTNTHCIAVMPLQMVTGTYNVWVSNKYGKSNAGFFTVTEAN